MEKLGLFGARAKCPRRKGSRCESLPDRRTPWLIPSRFLAACVKGHVEDFPFMEWVHKAGDWDGTHKLRLLAGRSRTGLAGISIRCSCGKSERLTNPFNFSPETGGPLHSIDYDCSESMPWLGRVGGKPGRCDEYLRVVQRGASNVYFPVTVSSIYLPLWAEDNTRAINKILDSPKFWRALTRSLDDGDRIQAIRCETVAELQGVDDEELRIAAQKKLDGTASPKASRPHSEEEFRRQEYQALRNGRGGSTTDLMVDVRRLSSTGDLTELFDRICLVRKLRETRVLRGFSRLLPADEPASADLRPISDDGDLNWLPATVVRGEGIFIEFNGHKLKAWAGNELAKTRVSRLAQSYNQSRTDRGLDPVEVSAKYVFLHTFAHALINQLSFDCGYGSASLRERIYWEIDDPGQPMQGVLIYTASGDSEGTLGGLVRQGEPDRLKITVERAIHQARWCSSDPVCIESLGQGSDNANLAACHGCVLLPETSCEMGNRLLDRGTLIGTPETPQMGLLSAIHW